MDHFIKAKRETREAVLFWQETRGSTPIAIACEGRSREMREQWIHALLPDSIELKQKLLSVCDKKGWNAVQKCCRYRDGCVLCAFS